MPPKCHPVPGGRAELGFRAVVSLKTGSGLEASVGRDARDRSWSSERDTGDSKCLGAGGGTQGERRVPRQHAHTAARDTHACWPTRVCTLAHGLCCQPSPGEGARSWLRDPGEEGTAQGTGDVGQGTCSPIAPSPPGNPRARQGTARWSPRSPKSHRRAVPVSPAGRQAPTFTLSSTTRGPLTPHTVL